MPDRVAWRASAIGAALLCVAVLTLTIRAQERSQVQDEPPGPPRVQITSPLGRTNAPGAIRIVARIEAASPADPVVYARFFVDDVLLGEDSDGAPWAVEWTDENPFEPRSIRVEAFTASGLRGEDTVHLKPFEVVSKAEVASVLVEAYVEDRKGRFVPGLGGSAFILEEDGERQLIDLVRPEVLPATFTLLVDSSQSMSRRIEFVRRAAADLMRYLRGGDRVIVAPFSKGLGATTGPTNDQATVLDAISRIAPHGGTAILDSLAEAASLVSTQDGRHAIVLITDGYDEHSRRDAEEVLAAVKRTGITVYVVGIGGVAGISIRGERLLRRIAEETGGRVFFPYRETQLPTVHTRVAEDVQQRYLVTYTPTNQKADGTWRSISLRVADPELRVRARPGYFAPEPPPVRASLEFTVLDYTSDRLELSAAELEVYEDGVLQTIDTFQEATLPVSIVFVLDTSGSMRRVVEPVKEAARQFVLALRPEDSLATILFADRPKFAHDLTLNRQWSLDAIDGYVARGGTALYDAVADALLRLRDVEGRRVVVVLTDGVDENDPGTAPGSRRTLSDVMTLIRNVEAAVFSIGLGTKIDRDVLNAFAEASGGEAFFPETVDTLPRTYARVLEALRRRYVVGYSSTNRTRDGAWRQVEIRLVDRPDAVVRSRGGYFAPGS